jgi:hypothetical protein
MTFLNLPEETDLVLEIRHLIDEARSAVASHINSECKTQHLI